ncbi:MAG TPA: universal stress protein [Thermodesulfobacteriota bacterium]|nr:universal stress protein [Thermodesulfobacteriota bacterium]
MFKKILVPLDGSELAAKIIPQVVDLAKTHLAEVTLLHVAYSEYDKASSEMFADAVAREAQRCAIFLDQVAGDMQAQGVNVKVDCIDGSPAREIINYANANKMDLIAMASHGRGGLAWLLGSVAEKVLNHANIPVLIYRVLEAKLPDLQTEYPIP